VRLEPPPISKQAWPTYALLALCLVIVHGLVVRFLVPEVLHGSLIDPDSYTRLVRVLELHRGEGWFDRVIDRMNAPYGLEMHWTRPLDILLLAGAWPLSAFLGFEDALYWAGVFVSPALHIATCVALVWAVAPLFAPEQRPLVAIVFLMQPLALNYAYAGRADHHMLLLLTYVIALGFLLRSLERPDEDRWSLLGGVAAGFGLWVSVEFLAPLVTLYAPLAAAWMVVGRRAGRAALFLSTGLLGTITLGVLLEGGPVGLFVAEYDRISIPYLALAAASWALWVGVRILESRGTGPRRTPSRILFLIATGFAALILVLLTFPGLMVGPMSSGDPRFESLLMQQIEELQSAFPTDLPEVGGTVAKFGHAVFAMAFLAWRGLPRHGRRSRLLWLPLLLALLLFVPLGLYQIRFGIWATVPIAVGVAGFLTAVVRRLGGRGPGRALARAAVVAGVLLAPLTLGGALLQLWKQPTPPPPRAGEAGCSVPELSSALSTGPGADTLWTILAHPNIGPELVYRTPHSVVAAGYHQNVDGVLDAHDILAATVDSTARTLVDARRIDLIVVCPQGDWWFVQGMEDQQATLFSRLLNDQVPSWLRPLGGPGLSESGFLVFAVARR